MTVRRHRKADGKTILVQVCGPPRTIGAEIVNVPAPLLIVMPVEALTGVMVSVPPPGAMLTNSGMFTARLAAVAFSISTGGASLAPVDDGCATARAGQAC